MSKAMMTTTLHRLMGLLLLLVGVSSPTQAFLFESLTRPDPQWGFINNVNLYKGHLYARGLYRTPLVNGKGGYLVYVVYNDKGEEIEEIGALEEDSPYANSIIMNAADYNHYINEYEVLLQNFEDFYGDDVAIEPQLLTADDYQEHLRELTVVGSDITGDWDGGDATHSISSFTASVLVLPEEMLYTAKTQYLLGAFPIDLTLSGQKTELDDETQSIILSAEGKVLYKSKDRIAHRSIFYEDLATETTDAGRWNQSSFTVAQDYSKEDLKLVQPVSGVAIVTNMHSMGGDTTDSNGQFNLAVRITPCPLFSYEMPIQLEAQIPYRPFNPELSRQSVYYLTKAGNFICQGYGPNMNTMVQRLDFPIDVNMISGQFDFPNVALATEADPIQLEYDFKTPELDENAEPSEPPPSRFTKARFESYDFDLDGQFDRSVCGNLSDDADKIFMPVSEADDQARDCRAATVQGIYLSGYPNAPYTCTDTDGDGVINPEDPNCQPQFTRLVDTQKISEDIGLVIRMATAHLQDTDLFIIRQATGQLVSMRQGLQDSEEAYGGSLNDIAATQDQVRANFRMLMRGPDSHLARSFEYSRLRDDDNGFSQWQQNSNMAPEFQKLEEADQVRTGEQLQLYAINRVTGYIGSASFTLEPAQIATGRLDTVLPTIEMLPPNLKIWAERTYDIEAGLTKDEQRRYLIGNEGVGEADDTYIQITVQWLDQDGRPLPAALSNYGYTGRLAYVSGSNTLADSAQTGQARFAIEPGTHVEVVRLSGGIANQHYYLQVNAVPAAEFDDFGLAGDGATPETQDRSEEATFKEVEHNLYRPERFVPFKTPQYSEEMTELQQQAHALEMNRRLAANIDIANFIKPEASYRWYYRPDYQFSVYDLEVQSIEVDHRDDTGEIKAVELINSDKAILTDKDELMHILFDIAGPDKTALERIDGQQTLVLAVGEFETQVEITDNQTIHFSNFDHLSQLESSDYLTIALYANEDEANILWQFAFGTFGIYSDENRDGRIVTKNNYSQHFVVAEPGVPTNSALESETDLEPETILPIMDRATTKEYPLLMWLNDDDDKGEIQSGADFSVSKFDQNSNNYKIAGMRDLVDYFPIFVDVQSMVKSFSPSQYEYILKEKTSSLKMVEAHANAHPSGDKILMPGFSDEHSNFKKIHSSPVVASFFEDLRVTPITARGVQLSDTFLYRAGKGIGGIILLEGVNRSQEDRPLELELVIQKKSTGEIESTTSMWIQTSPVEEMFRHINLQYIPGLLFPDEVDHKGFPNRLMPKAYPDKRTTTDYFVFLHGYNVMGEPAKGWVGEIFKRMYQAGFKGRFVGVTWHGASDNSAGAPDYHSAIYDAFVTSEVLAEEIPKYTVGASSVTLAGHSMGNVVISNAISQFGLVHDKYFMIDAAVAIEAYDAEQVTVVSRGLEVPKMFERMIEAKWKGYSEDVMASNWHKLFNEGDPRRKLTWNNHFSDALENAYNFYSSGENILENANESEAVLASWDDLVFRGGRHSWVTQEIGKGCQSAVFAFKNKPCQGGWEFNEHHPDIMYLVPTKNKIEGGVIQYSRGLPEGVNAALVKPDGDPNKLTTEALAQFGFFRKFDDFADDIYAPINEGNELRTDSPSPSKDSMEKLMERNETTWQLLASGIPVRSFAAGANKLDTLERFGESGRNFDMQDMRDVDATEKPFWPEEREFLLDGGFGFDWFHTDIRDVAYPYVYEVFDEFVNIIEGKESQDD